MTDSTIVYSNSSESVTHSTYTSPLFDSELSVAVEGQSSSSVTTDLFNRLSDSVGKSDSTTVSVNKVITDTVTTSEFFTPLLFSSILPIDSKTFQENVQKSVGKPASDSFSNTDSVFFGLAKSLLEDSNTTTEDVSFNNSILLVDSVSAYEELSMQFNSKFYLLREDGDYVLREDGYKIVRDSSLISIIDNIEPLEEINILASLVASHTATVSEVTSIAKTTLSSPDSFSKSDIASLLTEKTVSDSKTKTDSIAIGKDNVVSENTTHSDLLSQSVTKPISDTADKTDSLYFTVNKVATESTDPNEDLVLELDTQFLIKREDSGYILKEDGSSLFMREKVVAMNSGHWLEPLIDSFTISGLNATELGWLEDTEALRGIVFPVFYGQLYGDFTRLGAVLDQLASINTSIATPKKLALNFIWRTYSSTYNQTYLLPSTLRLTDSYGQINLIQNTDGGFCLRLWKDSLLNSYKLFIDDLVTYLASHAHKDLVSLIVTSESGLGAPTTAYSTLDPIYGTEANLYAAFSEIWEYLYDKFPNKLVSANLTTPNSTGEFVPTYAATLTGNSIGIYMQNSHSKYTLTNTLSLLSSFSNVIPILLRVGTEDYLSVSGDTSSPDYPSPTTIVSNRNSYNPNILVWNGASYFHTGNGSNQSVLQYLQSNSTVLLYRSRAGGLNNSYPTCYN